MITVTKLDPEADSDLIVEGMGTLLITDTSLIVDAEHPDSAQTIRLWQQRANRLLQLGNDMGAYTTHIISPYSALPSSRLLDGVFSDFVKACCYDLWCDAHVTYHIAGGIARRLTQEYGFSDGAYTMRINVYCDSASLGLLDRLKDEVTREAPLVVVRPDSSSRDGFSVELYSDES